MILSQEVCVKKKGSCCPNICRDELLETTKILARIQDKKDKHYVCHAMEWPLLRMIKCDGKQNTETLIQ
jgi:hypothetical protein